MPATRAQLPPSRRISGTGDPWWPVREDLARTGTALVHSRSTDWPHVYDDDNAMHALLGHEAPRWVRMPHNAARRQFGVSRVLLKHALGAMIGAPADSVELAKRPVGSPYARGCDRIEVSLSHTDGLVMVGLTTLGPIGVDVERADRHLMRDRLPWEICTPAELTALHALPPEQRNAALVRLWTLKEAYTKAVGQGLRFSFREFGFTGADPVPQLRGPDGEPADSGDWSFRTARIEDGYRASAAVLDGGRGRAPAYGPVELVDHEVVSMLSASLGQGN
jgi:4'-phosphopantetheinyl transferase